MAFVVFWLLNTIVSLVGSFWSHLSWLVNGLVQLLLILSLFFAVAYRLGWFHRLVWHALEQLGQQALNGTPVTIGSFGIDLLRGNILLNNVIVHSPHRSRFHWASPVTIRVGRVRLEFNPLSCLFAMHVLGEKVPMLDVTLLHISDIQVFLERSGHVFNVYLLDPFYVMPPTVPTQEQVERGVGAGTVKGEGAGVDERDNDPASLKEPKQTTQTVLFMEPELQQQQPYYNSSIRMIGGNVNNNSNSNNNNTSNDDAAERGDTAGGGGGGDDEAPMTNSAIVADAETAVELDRAELVVG